MAGTSGRLRRAARAMRQKPLGALGGLLILALVLTMIAAQLFPMV